MMRKLSILVVLCILLTAIPAAFAAATVELPSEYGVYENASFNYHVEYPSEWVLLDNETINTLIQQFVDGELKIEGFTSTALETMKSMISESGDNGFVEFIDEGGNNFNIVCYAYPGTPSSAEMTDVLAPQIIASYQANMSDITVIDGGSLFGVGDKQYLKVRCQYGINGQHPTVTSLYLFENDLLSVLTFTSMSSDEGDLAVLDQIMNTVLASFSLK